MTFCRRSCFHTFVLERDSSTAPLSSYIVQLLIDALQFGRLQQRESNVGLDFAPGSTIYIKETPVASRLAIDFEPVHHILGALDEQVHAKSPRESHEKKVDIDID